MNIIVTTHPFIFFKHSNEAKGDSPISMRLPTPSSMTDLSISTLETPFLPKLSFAIAKLRHQQQKLNGYINNDHNKDILKRKWSKLAYKRRELSLYMEQTYKNLQNIALNMR